MMMQKLFTDMITACKGDDAVAKSLLDNRVYAAYLV
jgi:hypothetical protein